MLSANVVMENPMTLSSLLRVSLVAISFAIAQPVLAKDNHDAPVLADYQYQYSEQLKERVAQAQIRAAEQHKLLLLVLGAQWCHDSRGLAQTFSTASIHTIISSRFETVFIDVGYYRDVRWLTEQYDYPGYFATPSVMVIDPKSGALLNRNTMPMWNTADSVSEAEYTQYFSEVGSASSTEPAIPQASLDSINTFAKQQTERLFVGFNALSPLLQAAVEDQPVDYAELERISEEVYEFRMMLQRDLHQLYKQAQLPAMEALSFPEYDLQSWESRSE